MSEKSQFLETVTTVANIVEMTKKTIAKVGLVYIKPLDESVQDEKILKAINQHSVKGATQ